MNKVILFAMLVALGAAHTKLSALSKKTLKENVWVVLAAGSDGYSNYRHQADVCHGYQVLNKLYGIPEEHIIMMMMDDIANNPSNPMPGKIINEPMGPDVYEGVPKDFTGRDLVTAETFKSILVGEDMTGKGSGKTLRSTADDYVFVFFDDHGAGSGALCFQDSCDLDSAMMSEIVSEMAGKGMFKELVIYVEACYAGGVFYEIDLPENVYVVTASPIKASSYAYNYDTTVGAYVADIFSYLWIHDLEVNSPERSFKEQFDMFEVSIENCSQPCQYGDTAFAESTMLSEVFGAKSAAARRSAPIVIPHDAIPEWDVPYETARRNFEHRPSAANRAALARERAVRARIDAMGKRVIDASGAGRHLATPPCTTCDDSCTCYRNCYDSPAVCEFECCNEQSCYELPPSSFAFDMSEKKICELTLVNEWLRACGNTHPYLRSVDRLLLRACRSNAVNTKAAVNAIRAECSAF